MASAATCSLSNIRPDNRIIQAVKRSSGLTCGAVCRLASCAAVDPAFHTLLDEWMNEAIGDIKEGLDRAGRSPAGTRHLRSVIAITELDYVARHWRPGSGVSSATRCWMSSRSARSPLSAAAPARQPLPGVLLPRLAVHDASRLA
ncbi:hypothetical protein Misp03_80420 [Microbispora sp. NBRC 16548]|nr:hypothetical protein Misp03_80420 [Microbispora sp. NBRC 16548]